MSHSHSQIRNLLILLGLLAVAGGIAIVAVTSPQSWELGPVAWLQGPPPTASPAPPTTAPPPTATVTLTATPPASATAAPTSTSSPTSAPSETPALESPTPAASPTLSLADLPQDVRGLAVVRVEGAANARVRDVPNGATVVAAVPDGTPVEVLFGSEEVEGIIWLPVRLTNGAIGWMADFLLEFVIVRP